uniref:Sushi domain-containing protein n=1 Tax=Panagrellus redivivus TaxID=6233 RepID=A0A7E4VYF9_PANRE
MMFVNYLGAMAVIKQSTSTLNHRHRHGHRSSAGFVLCVYASCLASLRASKSRIQEADVSRSDSDSDSHVREQSAFEARAGKLARGCLADHRRTFLKSRIYLYLVYATLFLADRFNVISQLILVLTEMRPKRSQFSRALPLLAITISQLLSIANAVCLQPDVPENGHVIFAQPGPYPTGTVAKYNCALGFERIGPEERVCTANGSWAGDALICAIDVAVNKPAEQSSGASTAQNAVLSMPNCALTDSAKASWWSVDLLGSFDVRAISITLGHLSSELVDVRLDTGNGTLISCAREVNTLKNSTILNCAGDGVKNVMVHAEARLHLCSLKVFAINAQSSWQCAMSTMDVLTIHDNNCYSASRMEKLDWKGAQKRCLDQGGTLPLRLTSETQKALRTALTATAQPSASFFWIGLMDTAHGWRWADGDPLDGGFEDWFEDPGEHNEGEAIATVLGRPASWKWMTAVQSAWNPWICQTKPKYCTSPGVSANGKVVFSSQSYAIGTYSFYSCEPGYQLIGDGRRRCQSDGRWSSTIPVCEPVDCGPPMEWDGGSIHLLNGSTAYGNHIEYRCRRGTIISHGSSSIRMCAANSKWSGSEPVCVDVDCGTPPNIANGYFSVFNTTLNQSAAYSCDDNFRLIGHSRLYCSESGQWHPAPPVCYDMLTLKEINDNTSSDKNLILCVVVAILLAILLLVAFKASQSTRFKDQLATIPNFNTWLRRGVVCQNGGKSPASDGPRHLVYATPSQPPDSMIYYAPTAASSGNNSQFVTQFEVPPHLVHLQQLPNGNIHVTLPSVRPMAARPSLLNASQLILGHHPAARLHPHPLPPPPPLNLPSMPHRPGSHGQCPPSPTSSQILYSFDHEPLYDQPPDNIYEELTGRSSPNTAKTIC